MTRRHHLLVPALIAVLACGCGEGAVVLDDAPSAPASDDAVDTIVLGTVTAPDEPGTAVVAWLDDGTPVWVIHRAEDRPSVVAGTTPATTDPGIEGLHEAVMWLVAERELATAAGRYDVEGNAIPDDPTRTAAPGRLGPEAVATPSDGSGIGPPRHLDRYRTSTAPDGSVVVHERVPGGPSGLSPAPPAGEAFLDDELLVRDALDGPPLSVADALAQPEGTVVAVEADVVRNGTQPLALCPTSDGPIGPEVARCPDGAPRPEGLSVPEPDPNSWAIWSGPLLARVTGTGLAEIAQLNGGGSGGRGSDEAFVTEQRVHLAAGSIAVPAGWRVVEVEGGDTCGVLSAERTLYVLRDEPVACPGDRDLDLPGAVVRPAAVDPNAHDRLLGGTPVTLYGTPGLAADQANAWLPADLWTYDYLVDDLDVIVTIADDPQPQPGEHVETEAILRSLRHEPGDEPQ